MTTVAGAAFARYVREAATTPAGATGCARERSSELDRPGDVPRRLVAVRRVVAVVGVVVAGAADHDLILLDRHLDRPVAGPVLGVDRVVLDGGVEPQPVALLAVVERRFERLRLAAGAPAPAAARRAGAWRRRLLGLVLFFLFRRPPRRAAGLGRLELGGDQRVVLGSEIDLVVEVDGRAGASGSPSGSRPCSRLNAWIC